MTQAYPLKWPQGWPRTKGDRAGDSRFRKGSAYKQDGEKSVYVGKQSPTFQGARKRITGELERLGAASAVISSNVPIRADGEPYSDAARRRMDDPGVAAYFMLKGRQMVMAQDAFDTPAGNLTSLALAVEAMRQLHRHGGGAMMERAFAGFTALPPPTPTRPWREVLNFDAAENVDVDRVRSRYRFLAVERSKDEELLKELNVARDAAVAEIGQ